jgi:glycine/D-amino acid oxidase-like deaminating enzyme
MPVFQHAVNHPDWARVIDPCGYTHAFGNEFLRQGGEFIRAQVKSLDHRAGMVTGARTQTDRYEADAYVIAAGAWSRKLASDIGSAVPLDTERGYHVVLSSSADAMTCAPVLSGTAIPLIHPMSRSN